jgi:hypothetical protein
MAEKRVVRPCLIASIIALVGLLTIPSEMSRVWASAQDQPPIIYQTAPKKVLNTRLSTTTTPQVNPRLASPAPTTLDDYAREVQDRLQAAARQVNTSGTANIKLTIERDGAVRQTEVIHLDGPDALRTQLMTIVSRMNLPPLPVGTTVDALVVDTILAFNYPEEDIIDRFGRISRHWEEGRRHAL